MQDHHNEADNPYKSPQVQTATSDIPVPMGDDSVARKFRQQILALGVFWAFIGTTTIYLAMMDWSISDHPLARSLDYAFAIGFIVVGILTCCKNVTATRVGLFLTYAFLVYQLLILNIFVAILLLLVISQGHRVLAWARRL